MRGAEEADRVQFVVVVHALSELGSRHVVVLFPFPDDLREMPEPQHALFLALPRHFARYPVPPLLASLGELGQGRLQRDLQKFTSII